MSYMFTDCSSLTKINIPNFNTKDVTCIDEIFLGCSSLRKNNVITNDSKLLDKLK